MKSIIVLLINVYQRFISPRKGFCCAYRTLKGGKSCSEYGKHSISNFGVLKGTKLLIERFRLCEQTFKISKEEKENEKERKGKNSLLGPCLVEGGGEIACCAFISFLN